MIQHELNEDDGFLMVAPQGPLEADDFQALAAEVDPFIERTGGLRGLLIEAGAFPGWDGFAGLMGHRGWRGRRRLG